MLGSIPIPMMLCSRSTFWADRNKIKKYLTDAFACGNLNMSQARAKPEKEENMKEFRWITDDERKYERAYIRKELAKKAEAEAKEAYTLCMGLCIGMFLMVLPICLI